MSHEPEHHGADYDWRRRFPDAFPIALGEGESVYAAWDGKGGWIIQDSGTLADFLNPGDPDREGTWITIGRFDDDSAWRAEMSRIACVWLKPRAEFALSDSVPDLARLAEDRSRERGLKRINERDHLQKWAVEVIGARALVYGVELNAGEPTGLGEAWPRLGGVDIVLSAPHVETPVFVELKCGAGRDAFGPCAWDTMKLAVCLSAGRTVDAYLLAAAPAASWDRPIRGAEFFADGSWSAEALDAQYADWWRHWRKAGYRLPERVPAGGTTQLVADGDFALNGQEWRIALSRVTVDPEEMVSDVML